MRKVMNFAMIAALAAGLLFFSIYPVAADSPLAGDPSATATLANPAPVDQPAQQLTGNPVLMTAVTMVVVLFGVLAFFPLVTVSQEEKQYCLTKSGDQWFP